MKLHTQNIRRNIIVKHFDSLNNFKMKRQILHICPPPLCVCRWWIVHIFFLYLKRLWAEVFHVSTSSAGTVRWQQISEDLVPVNISCIQDQPDYVFHITAYNSQVDKILDVRLTQPGMSPLNSLPSIGCARIYLCCVFSPFD